MTAVRENRGDKRRILVVLSSCHDCDMQNLSYTE